MYRLVCLLPFAFCAVLAARQPSTQLRVTATSAAVHETDHLTIKLSTADRGSGARVSLVVDIAPKPRMHVYAPEQTEYIPVRLTLDASDAYASHTPTFPPAEKYFFKPLNETQLVYSKPFRIVQPITLAPRDRTPTTSTALTITGTLRYQACDDAICYLPKTVPLVWKIGGNR